jgi:hypothetical protein
LSGSEIPSDLHKDSPDVTSLHPSYDAEETALL